MSTWDLTDDTNQKNPTSQRTIKQQYTMAVLKNNNMDLNTTTIGQSKLPGRMTSFWRVSFENRYSFVHATAKFD